MPLHQGVEAVRRCGVNESASSPCARQTERPLLGDEQQRDLVGLGGELALAVAPVEQPRPVRRGRLGRRRRRATSRRARRPLLHRCGFAGSSIVSAASWTIASNASSCRYTESPEIGRALQPTVAVQPAPDRRPLLPLALELHPMAIEQPAHAVMVGVDPLGTALDVLAVGER